MAFSLLSAQAKLARADGHLAELVDRVEGWSAGNPVQIERQTVRGGREIIFLLRFLTVPDTLGWGVLVGDVLHNLRGVLDHMVYGLAIANTGQDPPENDSQLMFPICASRAVFDGKRSQRQIEGLSDAARAAIERVQPYNRVKPSGFSPLWWLRQLNDVDKHRLTPILPIGTLPDRIEVGADPGTYRALWRKGPVFDGQPIFRLLLTEPNPNVTVNLAATGAVVLGVADIPLWGILLLLRSLRRETAVILRYLALLL